LAEANELGIVGIPFFLQFPASNLFEAESMKG